jgi:hypothetical protein
LKAPDLVWLALPESLWDQHLKVWSLGEILKFVVDEILCDAGNVTFATRKCIERYCLVIWA